MKSWQQFASEHHKISIINEDTIKISNIVADNFHSYYEVITRNTTDYLINSIIKYYIDKCNKQIKQL